MNDREPPQEPSPPGEVGETAPPPEEQVDEANAAGQTGVGPAESDAREAAREAVEEARRAASEAASKAAVAAREVGKELKDSLPDALDDIRTVAVEAGQRARAVTADVLDRAKSEVTAARDELANQRSEAAPGEASPAEPAAPADGAAPAEATVPAEANAPPATAAPADDDAPPDATPSSTGFDPNLAAALAYVCAPLTGPIFYIVEKQSRFVRFHAMQAILFAAATIISMSVFLFLIWIPLLGRFMFTMAGLGFIVTWLVVMWKALNYEEFRLPFIGDVARSQVRRRTEDS